MVSSCRLWVEEDDPKRRRSQATERAEATEPFRSQSPKSAAHRPLFTRQKAQFDLSTRVNGGKFT